MGLWDTLGGIAGGIGGFAVGGPVGAAAGYAAGSALGSAAEGGGGGGGSGGGGGGNANPDDDTYGYYGQKKGMADSDVQYYRGLADQTNATQAQQADYGLANSYLQQSDAARQQQTAALAMQARAAQGLTPSVAELQARNQMNTAFQNQLALQGSARGAGALGAAQANASSGLANTQANVIAQGQAARAAEMAQARDAYMAGASGIRGQDIGTSQLAGNQSLANAQLRAQQQLANQQLAQNYQKLGLDVREEADKQAYEAAALRQGKWATQSTMDENAVDRDWKYGMELASGAASVGAGLAGAAGGGGGGGGGSVPPAEVPSDEHLKTNVMEAGQSAIPMGHSHLESGGSEIAQGAALGQNFVKLGKSVSAMSDIRAKQDIQPMGGGMLMQPPARPSLGAAMQPQAPALGQRFGGLPQQPRSVPMAGGGPAPMPRAMPMGGFGAAPMQAPRAMPGPSAVPMRAPAAPMPPPAATYSAGAANRFLGAAPPAPGLGATAMGNVMSDEHLKTVPQHEQSFDRAIEMARREKLAKPYAAGEYHYQSPQATGVAAHGVMSDEGLKYDENEEPVPLAKRPALSTVLRNTDADKFLDTLKPYTYRYKNLNDEPTTQPSGGKYLGTMAQNIERGPTGHTIVSNTPKGKMLEGGALMSAMSAGLGRLHERMRELEAQRGQLKGTK